ncbi:unnamed protein product [Dovyalis caffra]|uniref:Uncharacterized protein n=1 Tax=Dovyalis caffra TaxID=77055 RepID=A0AAV1SV13_9ROSI|nr:unnamed protein product [Dovyalis caffra]
MANYTSDRNPKTQKKNTKGFQITNLRGKRARLVQSLIELSTITTGKKLLEYEGLKGYARTSTIAIEIWGILYTIRSMTKLDALKGHTTREETTDPYNNLFLASSKKPKVIIARPCTTKTWSSVRKLEQPEPD